MRISFTYAGKMFKRFELMNVTVKLQVFFSFIGSLSCLSMAKQNYETANT